MNIWYGLVLTIALILILIYSDDDNEPYAF